jgi:hypothetical protein
VRFVWAVTAFVLAALMIGAGIAQRTVFQGPKTQSQAISVTGDPDETHETTPPCTPLGVAEHNIDVSA